MSSTCLDKIDEPLFFIVLHVLGPFRAETDAGVDVAPRSRKARALLGILALSPPEGMLRSRLATLLWDRVEPDQARNLLRGAVHEIRTSFGADRDSVIQSTREHLALRRDLVRIDLDQLFEAADLDPALADRTLLDGLENTGRAFDQWLAAARLAFSDRLRIAHEKAAPATVRDPTPQRRRSGIRIGVAPIRSFSAAESDPIALVLAHEMSAALSRFRWISVPAPDAVAAALGPDRNAQAAFTALELDFLLDSQLQVANRTVRLRASLISAIEAAIVWTFKADRDAADLLSFEDEIAAEVAARIDSHLFSSESHRASESPLASHDAYGLVMRAVRTACSLDPNTFASAADLLAEATRLEPNRPMAHISTALFYLIAASQSWYVAPREALQRAENQANIALSMDSSEAQAWAIAGYVRAFLHRQPEEATGLLRRAIEMNPNLPTAYHFSAANFLFLGDLPQARANIARYEKLGPTGVHFFGNNALMTLSLFEGNDEEVVRIGRTTLRMHPNFAAAYKPFLAALGHLGLREEAATAYAQLRRLEPTFNAEDFLAANAFRRPQDRDRFATGLRLAEDDATR